MLDTSILGKAYYIWINSRVFDFMRSIFAAFSRGFKNSKIMGFLLKENRVEDVYADSLIARILKWIFDLIFLIISKIGGGIARAAKGSYSGKFASRFIKSSVFFSFETLLGGFICLMFIMPHSYWSNPYALLAGIGLCVLFFILVGLGLRKPFYIHEMGLPLALFAICCAFGVISSLNRPDSLRVFTFFISSFLLVYLICADINTRDRLMKLLGFIYVAVVLMSLYAIAQRIMGVKVNTSFTDIYVNKGVPGRVYSTLDNSNNFAEFLVLMTPLAAVFAGNVKNQVLKLFCSLALLPSFLALLMTYSRSSWIAMALTAVLFVYYANKRLVPVMFLFVIASIPFWPDSVMIRLASIINTKDSSISFRFLIWEGTTKIARDYFFTGIGLGPAALAGIYQEYANDAARIGVAHSHMVYLELIVEMGIMGFLSFMWYMLRMWKDTGLAIYRQKEPVVRLALAACLASLIGTAITFTVEYVWYYPRVMFAYFIVCAIAWSCVRITRNAGEIE